MGKILVVAEKPSVGRDIAKVLGASAKGAGYLYGDEYVVSWAVGHLVRLFEPQEYDERWKRWSYDVLPMIPEKAKLKPEESARDQLKVLQSLMNSPKIDKIICATDAGREGELIFRYIYEYIKCQKPFERLWISSMTDKAIKDGFKALKPGADYDALYNSARCRSEADWLVGMNASRAYTLTYGVLLSVGRVQTPTLAILVNRKKEIDAFDSREYFEVTAAFSGGYSGKRLDTKEDDTKIFDGEKAAEIAAKVDKKTGAVTAAVNEEKRMPPPQLYDLTELQRDANKKLGLSAKQTLETAQSLYEKRKLITYPRTDSRYISEDMADGLPKLIKRLSEVEEYGEYAGYVQSLPKLPITKRFVDGKKVSDHHAIIITDANAAAAIGKLTYNERNVYDLIARRFLCVFYPNYVYDAAKIITTVEGEPFISRGTTVKRKGWTEIYEKLETGDRKPEEEPVLPPLSEGDAQTVLSVDIAKKKTQPPKPYTEAALLGAMENAGRFVEDEELREKLKESGLGTPATRAGIIERLLQVGYAERKGKSLIPTQKGVALIEAVPDQLKSPETTGRWEKGLSKIAKGEMDALKFMASIERFAGFLVGAARVKTDGAVFPEEERRRGARG